MDEPFSNREIEGFHNTLNTRMDKFENETRESHNKMTKTLDDLSSEMKIGFDGVHKRQDEANHKVQKIIIALVFAFGLIIGLGVTDFNAVIRLFL